MVPGHLGQKKKKFVRPNLNGKNSNEKLKIGRSWFRLAWVKSETLSPK
jgi:hypothetical protein